MKTYSTDRIIGLGYATDATTGSPTDASCKRMKSIMSQFPRVRYFEAPMRLTIVVIGTPTPGEVADALRELATDIEDGTACPDNSIMRDGQPVASLTVTAATAMPISSRSRTAATATPSQLRRAPARK